MQKCPEKNRVPKNTDENHAYPNEWEKNLAKSTEVKLNHRCFPKIFRETFPGKKTIFQSASRWNIIFDTISHQKKALLVYHRTAKVSINVISVK